MHAGGRLRNNAPARARLRPPAPACARLRPPAPAMPCRELELLAPERAINHGADADQARGAAGRAARSSG
jgi:hypothetical protein